MKTKIILFLLALSMSTALCAQDYGVTSKRLRLKSNNGNLLDYGQSAIMQSNGTISNAVIDTVSIRAWESGVLEVTVVGTDSTTSETVYLRKFIPYMKDDASITIFDTTQVAYGMNDSNLEGFTVQQLNYGNTAIAITISSSQTVARTQYWIADIRKFARSRSGTHGDAGLEP